MAPRKSARAKKVVNKDQDSDYEEGGAAKRGARSDDEFEGESTSLLLRPPLS